MRITVKYCGVLSEGEKLEAARKLLRQGVIMADGIRFVGSLDTPEEVLEGWEKEGSVELFENE